MGKFVLYVKEKSRNKILSVKNHWQWKEITSKKIINEAIIIFC